MFHLENSDILAIDFEPCYQAQVLAELTQRRHLISRTTSQEVDYLEIFTTDATIIYLPLFDQHQKTKEFLQMLRSYQIVTIGLSQSLRDHKLYQQQFPRLHFESLIDVVVPRSCTEITDIIEEKIAESGRSVK